MGNRGYNFSSGDRVASVWCAQLYAQHMAHLLRSAVRLPLQVVVPMQLLMPTATYKWVAYMFDYPSRLAGDVEKLLGRLGRLGRHRVHDSHFWRCLHR